MLGSKDVADIIKRLENIDDRLDRIWDMQITLSAELDEIIGQQSTLILKLTQLENFYEKWSTIMLITINKIQQVLIRMPL